MVRRGFEYIPFKMNYRNKTEEIWNREKDRKKLVHKVRQQYWARQHSNFYFSIYIRKNHIEVEWEEVDSEQDEVDLLRCTYVK
jgi:hypothetical protein